MSRERLRMKLWAQKRHFDPKMTPFCPKCGHLWIRYSRPERTLNLTFYKNTLYSDCSENSCYSASWFFHSASNSTGNTHWRWTCFQLKHQDLESSEERTTAATPFSVKSGNSGRSRKTKGGVVFVHRSLCCRVVTLARKQKMIPWRMGGMFSWNWSKVSLQSMFLDDFCRL